MSYVNKIIAAIHTIYDEEADLVHLPEELKDVENRLNQLKYDFFRNQQLAKEAEKRKNDLVVYLAHDLKTPLTSIIGYMTLLHDEEGISQELRKKYSAISLKKAERLEDLINEFFEITRFNLNDIALEKSNFNLTRMLEQMIFEFNPLFQTKHLRCDLSASKEVMLVGDVNKLERAFDNLIRNAINYSYEDSEIKISVEEKDEGITLRFLNEGDTIPEHKLNRIFEQFYRLDTARATNDGGAGLGLAITKKIIEMHNGDIEAWSEEQKFQINLTLPKAP